MRDGRAGLRLTVEAAEQIPILCGRCGGRAESTGAETTRCSFCGVEERLPEDQLGRVLELKRRLAAASRSVAQLGGLESALGRVFEERGAFLRASAPYLFLAVAITAWSVVNVWPTLQTVPPELRVSIAIHGSTGPLFVSGMVLAISLALFVGRWRYRRSVRPLLFARAPREPGLPTRCRACGADLPDSRGPFIGCTYCRTENLVSAEIQRDRERLLADEERFHRDRANQAAAVVAHGSIHMTRTFIVAIVLVYLGMIGVAAIANAFLPG